MRVLAATMAGAGHFGPLVPFVTACSAAGHEVRVAAPASFADTVRQAGFTHVPLDDADPSELGAVFGTLPGLSVQAASTRVVREVFGGVNARAALPGLRAAVREWKPDLILREGLECASYVVAESEDVPHATVAIGLAEVDDFVYPALDGALEELGSTRGVAGLRHAPTLSTVPVSLELPGAGERAFRFRDEAMVAGATELPAWWPEQTSPLVYVSFGTVAARMGSFPTLYRGVIDAVAGEPVRVLVTVGESGDPCALGSLPIRLDTFAEKEGLTYDFLRPGLSLADFIDADISGRDFAKGKPDPEIFLTAASELDVAPERCFVVEDAASGVEAAKAGGMAALGLARADDEDLLTAAKADLVVTSLDAVDVELLARHELSRRTS